MRVKFGLKISNRLEKMPENLSGGFFLTHTVFRAASRSYVRKDDVLDELREGFG